MFSIAISGPSTPGMITWLPDEGFLEAGDGKAQVEKYMQDPSTPQWEKDEWKGLNFDEQLIVAMLSLPSKSLCTALALRRIKQGAGNSGRFHLKHLEAETEDTPNRKNFEFVIDWIKQQNIFDEIGRVQFFINTDGHGTPIHRDYADKSRMDQFIWIRFFNNKQFFVYDSDDKIKAIWAKQYALTPFLAPSNFKSYDELKEKLNRVITGTRNTATIESAELPPVKSNDTVKSNGKTTTAASDDDDTLSYFSKLADDE